MKQRNYKPKNCDICGNGFIPKMHNQKYCKKTSKCTKWRVEYKRRREKYISRAKQYVLDNPEYVRAYNVAIKARKKCESYGFYYREHFSLHDWLDVKAVYEGYCVGCGRKEPEIRLTVDHKIPIILGGPNTKDNLQPLCLSCNVKKAKKVMFPAYNLQSKTYFLQAA